MFWIGVLDNEISVILLVKSGEPLCPAEFWEYFIWSNWQKTKIRQAS